MTLTPRALAIFETTKARSEAGLQAMRKTAAEIIGNDDRIIVGVNGSYARREVTTGSDVDLFVLFRKDALGEASQFQSRLRDALSEQGFKMPASDGVFERPLAISGLTQTIGGMDDSNDTITRRMLLLLEGEWVYGEAGFEGARTRLLNQYLAEAIRPDQISMFLLNDIIRYWRTICVDLEHKVQVGGKPRAIRLIKLRFSRMLLFVAGVLAVGQTYDVARDEKLLRLNRLLSLPVCERVKVITGDNADALLDIYAEFLAALDDDQIREKLSQQSPDGEQTAEFLQLRAKAQDFRVGLLAMLQSHFGDGNPTLSALML
jgi:predicted nucleotidyltransferase